MAQENVEIDSKKVTKAIRRLDEVMMDGTMESFFRAKISPFLSARAAARFAAEGDDASGPWAPLSKATMVAKKKSGASSRGINVRTGELRNWAIAGGFRVMSASAGAAFIYPRRAPTLDLRKKVIGAQQGEGAAPPRPVLALSENDAEVIVARMKAMLDSAMQ